MRFILFFSVVLVFVLLLAAFAGGQTPSQPATALPGSVNPASALPAAPTPAVNTPTVSEEMEWSRVQQLVHDQPIHISANGGRRESCLFTSATSSMLFCEPEYASRPGIEYRFSRADVEKIRLDQTNRNMHRAIVIPTIAGAVAGVIFGAVQDNNDTCPTGLCELAGGVIGAFAGGLAGFAIALPAGLLIPGKRIYHREQHRDHQATAHRTPHRIHFHFAPAPSATP